MPPLGLVSIENRTNRKSYYRRIRKQRKIEKYRQLSTGWIFVWNIGHL